MIKKYSLQRKIESDEDYNTFIKHNGLLVLDVYKEFFGPCTGMVSTLRKLKEMDGFEDLHLAICKSDNIKALKKYRTSCIPTWIFMINGVETELMFGANGPILEKLIRKHLKQLLKKCPSVQGELNENEKVETRSNMSRQSIKDENKENIQGKINKINKENKPTDDDQPKFSILEFF